MSSNDPVKNVCSHYMSSSSDTSLLREIREPVWSYIIDVCSSFSARVVMPVSRYLRKQRSVISMKRREPFHDTNNIIFFL